MRVYLLQITDYIQISAGHRHGHHLRPVHRAVASEYLRVLRYYRQVGAN